MINGIQLQERIQQRFCEDLSVRKNELVQVLRCTHPHWIWVRNEESSEGFVPTDCLMASELTK